MGLKLAPVIESAISSFGEGECASCICLEFEELDGVICRVPSKCRKTVFVSYGPDVDNGSQADYLEKICGILRRRNISVFCSYWLKPDRTKPPSKKQRFYNFCAEMVEYSETLLIVLDEQKRSEVISEEVNEAIRNKIRIVVLIRSGVKFGLYCTLAQAVYKYYDYPQLCKIVEDLEI